jgi:hypothetical protein
MTFRVHLGGRGASPSRNIKAISDSFVCRSPNFGATSQKNSSFSAGDADDQTVVGETA